MSKVIKSFRVIEREIIPEKTDKEEVEIKEEDTITANQDIYREVIIEKAEKEAEQLRSIAEEYKEKTIEDANLQASRIIEKAKEEASSIGEQAHKEGYSSGLTSGREEGYASGYSEGKLEADKLIGQALEIKNTNLNTRDNLLLESEKDIINLVNEIYKKVFYEKTDQDEDMILSLILEGLKNLESVENLTIIVSKEDYEKVLDEKNIILAQASLINNLEIKYDIAMVKGDCVLETPKGNIDISLREQIAEIERLLKNILDNE